MFYDILYLKKGGFIVNFTIAYPIIWLIILVVTLVAEALTAGLVTIWFSTGALAALVTAVENGLGE